MRVNIYAEEMTNRVTIVEKTTDDGTFTGVRFYLELPVTIGKRDGGEPNNVQGPFLHRATGLMTYDDDSAAVTFWGKRDLAEVLAKAQVLLAQHWAKRSRTPPGHDDQRPVRETHAGPVWADTDRPQGATMRQSGHTRVVQLTSPDELAALNSVRIGMGLPPYQWDNM